MANKETENTKFLFVREYWNGDSRDGSLVNGDGYHYYRMLEDSRIVEAYEYYEKDDGTEVASPLPEMLHKSWKEDFGFPDLEALDMIDELQFERIKELIQKT